MRGCRRKMTKNSNVVILKSAGGDDLVPTSPTDSKDWPKREHIWDGQDAASVHMHEETADYDCLVHVNEMAWIPDDADDLKVKLLEVSHASHAGHRGGGATAAALRETLS